MIPIRDAIPSRTYPLVTVGLIVVNSLVFLFELSLGERLNDFILDFGIVPIRLFHSYNVGYGLIPKYLPFITSMFLHGGWFHVIGNMWYLWIFGDNVEDRMGHFKYFIFYLLCGFVAGFVHIFMNRTSGVPTIGASGAIAGVMGAYFILYPNSKIWTLIPVFLFFRFVEIPAFILLGFWVVMQFLSSAFSSGLSQQGGVAWWAHIGGFAAGVVLVFVFKKRKSKLPRQYDDEYWPC